MLSISAKRELVVMERRVRDVEKVVKAGSGVFEELWMLIASILEFSRVPFDARNHG